MSFRGQRLRGRGEVHYATGHALSIGEQRGREGGQQKGIKMAPKMDLEFRKKHNPIQWRNTVSSGRGFIVEVAERVAQRSGDLGSGMGKELSKKVERPRPPPPPLPTNPTRRPPTSKTVAPSGKSACLPLGLDPVLCPEDDSHASK